MNFIEVAENRENLGGSPYQSPNPYKSMRRSPLHEKKRRSSLNSPLKTIHTPKGSAFSPTGRLTPLSIVKPKSPSSKTPNKVKPQPLSPIPLGSPIGKARTPIGSERTPKRDFKYALHNVLNESFLDIFPDIDLNATVESLPNPLQNSPKSNPLTVRPHDAFGFLYDEESMRVRTDEIEHCLENDSFWESWCQNDFQFHSKEAILDAIMTHGVSHEYRSRIWPALLNVKAFKSKQAYKYSDIRMKGRHPVWSNQIDLDLHRTYSTHTHFLSPNSRGQRALSNVLNAYAHINEDIGYCQGMGFLVGLLLMIMDEETTFWTFATLLEKCEMANYYEPSMSGLLRDSERFNMLIKLEKTEVYQLLRENGIDCTLFISRWFLQLYTDFNDWRTVLRIWDYVLYTGKKGIFHVAMALIHLVADDILSLENPDMAFPYLLSIPTEKIDPSRLFSMIATVDIDRLLQSTEKGPFMTPIKIKQKDPKGSLIKRLWTKITTPTKKNIEKAIPSTVQHMKKKRLSPLGQLAYKNKRTPSPRGTKKSPHIVYRSSKPFIQDPSFKNAFKEFTMRTPSKDYITPKKQLSHSKDESSPILRKEVLSPIEMMTLSEISRVVK